MTNNIEVTKRQIIQDINDEQIYPYYTYSFLGQGTYGNVWLCGLRKKKPLNKKIQQSQYQSQYQNGQDFIPQTMFAIKKCLLEKKQYKQYKRFSHPNIIKLQNVIFGKNQYQKYTYLVFKNYFTDLDNHRKRLNKLLPQQIQILIKDILSAIIHISNKNYWHSDIKAQNIFICQKGRYVLGDLGLTTKIIQQQHKSIDFLMLGAIVWKVCGLYWPYPIYWPDINQIKLNQNIQNQLILNDFGSQKIKEFLYLLFSNKQKLFPCKNKLIQIFSQVKYLNQIRRTPTPLRKRNLIKRISTNDTIQSKIKNINKIKAINKARKYRNKNSKTQICPICQIKQSRSNFKRHQKSCIKKNWSDWYPNVEQTHKKNK